MTFQTQRFLSTRLLPSGRRLRVLRQLALLVAAEPAVAAALNRAEAAIQHERTLARQWSVQRLKPASASRKAEAYKLDPQLDRLVSAIQQSLDARLSLMADGTPAYERAAALLAEAFPFGVAHVTRRGYEEQIALVFELLHVLRAPEHAEAVEDARLTEGVARLGELADAFDAALGAGGPERLAYAAVAEAERAGHEAYADVLVGLLFVTASTENRAKRAAWLAPHQQQLDAAAALRVRAISGADIDPDTGDIEPATPETPAADAG